MSGAGLKADVAEALVRAGHHATARHPWEAPAGPVPTTFTIALSRAAGACGTSVARAVGARLGWPVYDHELLERIADDAKVRVELLDRQDEQPRAWLTECVDALVGTPTLTEAAYAHRMGRLIWSLATRGSCVIVGRGAAQLLPENTTLRVRLVGQAADRAAVIGRELGVPLPEAMRKIEEIDRARDRFVREHFQRDPSDPQNFDLVLNSSRLTVEDCADLTITALRRLEARAS